MRRQLSSGAVALAAIVLTVAVLPGGAQAHERCKCTRPVSVRVARAALHAEYPEKEIAISRCHPVRTATRCSVTGTFEVLEDGRLVDSEQASWSADVMYYGHRIVVNDGLVGAGLHCLGGYVSGPGL